jgi:hypothetical protein
MNKSKITKYVWFKNSKWKVEQILQPTPFDNYLLLSQIQKDVLHSDDKTHQIIMILIDCDNDEFYLDLPEIRKFISEQNKTKQQVRKRQKLLAKKLLLKWLDIMDD